MNFGGSFNNSGAKQFMIDKKRFGNEKEKKKNEEVKNPYRDYVLEENRNPDEQVIEELRFSNFY